MVGVNKEEQKEIDEEQIAPDTEGTVFDDIIGNDNLKLQLQIAIKAASLKNSSLPHLLFNGPPGCGKTTLARAISQATDSQFLFVTSEQFKKAKDFLEIFNKFDTEGYNEVGERVGRIYPPVLFIDEIHQMNTKAQEILGIAMEEYIIEAPCESKYSDYKKMAVYWVPKFTVIGATTLLGKLTKPFRDRFKIILDFKKYSESMCQEIAHLHAKKRELELTDTVAAEIAKRSRGTPRIVVQLLDRIHDAAVVLNRVTVTKELSDAVFDMINIDEKGLNERDIKVLVALYNNEVPLGIDILAVITQEDRNTLLKSTEPYLIQIGFMLRTKRGRIITPKGIEHLENKNYIQKKSKNRVIKIEN